MIEQIKIEYTNNINIKKILNYKYDIKDINKLVKKVLGEALNFEVIPYNFFILISFINNEEIKKINKKYRNIDKITDVLSFPIFKKDELEYIIKYNKDINRKKNKDKDKDIKENKVIEKIDNINNIEEYNIEIPTNLKIYLENEWSIGEIYINLEQIKKQAEEYNHSFERELSYILVHGFYHLLGYDHQNKDEQSIMREKEENILNILDIKRGDNK